MSEIQWHKVVTVHVQRQRAPRRTARVTAIVPEQPEQKTVRVYVRTEKTGQNHGRGKGRPKKRRLTFR